MRNPQSVKRVQECGLRGGVSGSHKAQPLYSTRVVATCRSCCARVMTWIIKGRKLCDLSIKSHANSVWSSWLSSDMTSGTLNHILYGYPAVFRRNYMAVASVKIHNGAQEPRHTYCWRNQSTGVLFALQYAFKISRTNKYLLGNYLLIRNDNTRNSRVQPFCCSVARRKKNCKICQHRSLQTKYN